jgi:hypothetical protein
MAAVHSIQGDAVAWREVDGEFVLISVETTHYYSLNSTGSDAWRILLEGPQTADSIAGALAVRHGLDPMAIHGEVSALLEQLRSEGLTRMEEAGDALVIGAPPALDRNGAYEAPSLSKYDALERLILSGE